MTHSWLSWLKITPGQFSTLPRSRPCRSIRLECEPLEDRVLLSASSQLLPTLRTSWKALVERRIVSKASAEAKQVRALYRHTLAAILQPWN